MSNIELSDLTDIELDGIDTNDYPDFCDAYITYAYCETLGRELTDDELDAINDNHRDLVYDCVISKLF